jgi:3-phenylpropionate/cinnamic acid dioxygenase small subunit
MLTSSEAVDLAELNQLAYRYAAAVDGRDVDGFLDVFHPEARLRTFRPGADEPSSVATGHPELARIPGSMRERFTRTAHFMTNHLVHLDGQNADGTLLCTARHLFANAAGGTDFVVVLRYVDRYQRRQDSWRILDREIRFLWTETHATLRDDQSLVPSPRSDG